MIGRDKIKKLAPVGQIILAVIGTAAFIGAVAVAPGVIVALHKLGIDKKLINRRKYYVDDSLDRLIKRGLISEFEKGGKKYLKLTKEGKRSLFRFETKSLAIEKPPKWDGKYRVIIFDIKESDKFIREDLRYFLMQFGFIKLQNSVWVYPYPCEGVVHLMKTNLEIGDEVVYMTVESIDNDGFIRKHFGL